MSSKKLTLNQETLWRLTGVSSTQDVFENPPPQTAVNCPTHDWFCELLTIAG
jgi:hypothetical protein